MFQVLTSYVWPAAARTDLGDTVFAGTAGKGLGTYSSSAFRKEMYEQWKCFCCPTHPQPRLCVLEVRRMGAVTAVAGGVCLTVSHGPQICVSSNQWPL